MNDLHYIAAGRLIAAILGKDISRAYCSGTPIDYARYYKDSVVEIISSTKTLEFGMTKLDNNNPVYMMNEKGELYRTHGEARDLKEHLFDLYNQCSENLEL